MESGLETVDGRLMVRWREAKVGLKSLEVEAVGPETDLFVDMTESARRMVWGGIGLERSSLA